MKMDLYCVKWIYVKLYDLMVFIFWIIVERFIIYIVWIKNKIVVFSCIVDNFLFCN